MKASKDEKGVIHVCGFVNAKNSYGGYTGMKPFVGVLGPTGTFGVAAMGGTDGETFAVNTVCQTAGIQL